MYDQQAKCLQSLATAIESRTDMPTEAFAEALRRLNCVYARRVFWRDRPEPEPELAHA